MQSFFLVMQFIIYILHRNNAYARTYLHAYINWTCFFGLFFGERCFDVCKMTSDHLHVQKPLTGTIKCMEFKTAFEQSTHF